ncbi:MAG: hypothetical protein KFKLKKLM_00230 [Flavobacteriales bacterium]|nr:hypothetical protein [Flavobacteriales bacterium]
MKNSIKTVLLTILLTAYGYAFSQKANKTETITIQTSAQCDMCKHTIEKAMAYEKGVKKSTLDVPTSILTVEYNPAKTTPEKIRKAVSDVGYDADDVPANPKAYEKLNPCCKKGAHK